MHKESCIMPSEDLRKLQLIQLDMLLEVDRICKKHKIKYCIIAGTLLGAVRHKGFIPWDDDIDIAMFRPEYERFCEICEKELDSDKYYLQTHRNTKGYRWGYGKIRRVGTEFVRSGQEHMDYPTGVFIDIFPLDNVPDNIVLRWFHNLICTIVRKFLWSKAGAKADSRMIMRLIYKIMALVPKNFIFLIYDLLVKISNRKETKMVRTLTFPTPKNRQYGYYRKWYDELELLEFEGYYFPAPKDYDEYLRYKFGDYEKLPPVELRKGHSFSRYKLI